MQNNDKILTENEPKNSKARIKANGKYLKNNYKRINIAVRPEQADRIKETAKRFDLSLAQLIIDSVQLYNNKMCNCTSTGSDPTQPENVTTESPMKSGETAGAQPDEVREEPQEEQKPQEENETENEIETEEENQTAGAEEEATETEEEPQDDEDEDEKPEDIPAFVWEQIQRLKKADKRQTAERKAREAAERKRRRAEEGTDDY